MDRARKRKKWGIYLGAAVISASAFSEPYARPLPAPDPRPSIESDEPAHYRSSRLQFSTELSMLSPTIFEGESTRIEKALGGIPVISMGVKIPLFQRGQFQFHGEATVGFGTNGGSFQVSAGDLSYAENAQLLWVPVTVSFATDYEIAGLPFIKPMLSIGVGGHFLSQKIASGRNRDILAPFFSVRPHLMFLQNSDPNGWFGGFSFGISRLWSAGPSRVSASSIDMAFLFNL